ncbi:MAG: secretin N-terminal domain-containing protein, partial [Solirubrobacterales bacterium]
MNTQRHHNNTQLRSDRPARRRTALLTLALWTLMTATGCRTQQETAGDSPGIVPQSTPQAQNQTPPANQATVRSPVAPQRITSPAAVDRTGGVIALGTRRSLAEEVVSPAEFASQSPVKEQKLVNTPAARQEPLIETSPQSQTEAAAPLVAVVPPQSMPALKPGMADEMVSVNFDNVDIRTVLKTIGDITGINFIPHESVTGNVTVMSPTPIRLGDLYAFLQSILDVHGYATIEMNNAVKVVPKADAARNHLQVRIGADPAYIPKTDVVVTQILPLKHADADDIRQIIEPILSTGAQLATYPRTNSLMITDTSANIHHIAQVIQQLDVEGSQEKAITLPLTHANSKVLSEQITRILEKNKSVAPQAGGRVSIAPAGSSARVMSDDRTNSLIVIANEQDAATIRGLVDQLDVPRPAGINNVHVVYLKNADANEVSQSLQQAMASMKLTGAVEGVQQVQVTPDASTNALVVVASPQDFEVVDQIIQKLDIVREQVLVEMLITEVTEESL